MALRSAASIRPGLLGYLLLALASCALVPPKVPDYPWVAPGPEVASLLIDTNLEQSITRTFEFEVYVDGFKLRRPPRKDTSKMTRAERKAQRSRRARFALRLEPGNHQVLIVGLISQAAFDPLVVRADVVAGRRYSIRLTDVPGTAFGIHYEGWSDDEAALWPRERRVELGLF